MSESVTEPVEVKMCDLWKNPEQYAGKLVRVRGNSRGDLWIEDLLHDSRSEPCPAYMRITVAFPDKVVPAPVFHLIQDESYAQFVDALNIPGPVHIDATFEGRFDAAFVWRDHKRIKVGVEKKGYGRKHDFDGRIVLHKVSDVWAEQLPRK